MNQAWEEQGPLHSIGKKTLYLRRDAGDAAMHPPSLLDPERAGISLRALDKAKVDSIEVAARRRPQASSFKLRLWRSYRPWEWIEAVAEVISHAKIATLLLLGSHYPMNGNAYQAGRALLRVATHCNRADVSKAAIEHARENWGTGPPSVSDDEQWHNSAGFSRNRRKMMGGLRRYLACTLSTFRWRQMSMQDISLIAFVP